PRGDAPAHPRHFPARRRPSPGPGALRPLHRPRSRGVPSRPREPAAGGAAMTNEEWFEHVTAELLAQSPFRQSEYFKRFRAGVLTPEQAWVHLAQHYLLIAWFPRIFSGIHSRCEVLAVRQDCARHLLV